MASQGEDTADGASSSLLATCDRCGDVLIEVRRARVSRNWAPGHGWFAFDCPVCTRATRVPAHARLLNALVCLGAEPASRSRHLRLLP